MAAPRILITVVVAAVLTLAAVVVIGNSPASEPRPAFAGPCDPSELFFSDDSLFAPPLTFVFLYGVAGRVYGEDLDVDISPNPLPTNKPPVTITAVEVDGHPGIVIGFNPSSKSGGSFTTKIKTGIDLSVPPGLYQYEIEIDCHGTVTSIPFTVYVDTCPAPSSAGFQISGVQTTPTPEPFPDSCEEPTSSPTPPPGTPTPTAAPGQQVKWADNNCSSSVDPVDSLLVLRGDAGLPANTGDCPGMGANIEVLNASPHIWGDVDCKDGMSPVDSLKILRHDAGLSASQEQPCPGMASDVTIREL